MAAPVTRDQELDLRIDSLAFGGNGVARLDGYVVFVRRGLPGDRVRARVTKVKRSHAEALALEVLEPGPQRVEAPCPHFGACGGCRFQDLAYEAQLEAKQAQIVDSLRRLGGIAEPPVGPIVPSSSIYGYRNKLEYSFTQTEAGPALGFHAAGRWDEVLPIEVCLLTTDTGNAIRDAVQAWAREEGLPAYDQADNTGYLRHLVVREGRNTGQALVQLVTAEGERFDRDYLIETLRRIPEVQVDPLGRQRHARRGHEPALAAALGRGGDRGGAARAPLPRPSERLPADEHRDGRDALPARDRGGRADRRGDGLRPVLRHRHDGAGDGRRTRSRCGGSRSRRSRSPARSRTPS